MTPPAWPSGNRPGASRPLRLVGDDPGPVLPVAPPAGSAVWEGLDRAAAWVCDHWSGGGTDDRSARWQALRVLCIAARAAAGSPATAEPLSARDLPGNVQVGALLDALRQRFVARSLDRSADAGAGEPTLEPAAVLRVVAALDRLGETLRGDATRAIVDQLSGASSLDLLVEVAHDMRSPLASILFLLDRMRGGADADLTVAQRRQLALVYEAAYGLSAMVGDVMELARGGDRLASGAPAPLALPELVEGVRAIVQPLAEEKGLTLEIGAMPPESRLGHAAGVQRVLLNLVTNALKYTPSGTVTLRAEALGDQARGDQARVDFTIADTGRGIPPQVLASLFQAFRPRPTRDFAFSSAGLGLAICRKLVEAMGGEMTVESALGRGTTFRVALPLPLASLG